VEGQRSTMETTATAIESFKTGPMDNNVYVLIDEERGRCAVVDPGIDSGHILRALQGRGLTVAAVVNTHGHFDHVAGNALFLRASGVEAEPGLGTPLYRHPLDEEMSLRAAIIGASLGIPVEASPPATHTLEEGGAFTFGPHRFRVLHVPGHSPGSVVLVGDGLLIGGDVLFRGSIGRTDLPGGSLPQLLSGIRAKILPLPDDTRVLPGHGPETTVGRERHANPFLER